jgi:hypothetical protein
MEKPESGHICYNNPILLEPIGLKGGRINPNFPLSTRTKNCLMADSICYVATLTSLTNRQLLNVPHLGKKSYHEVINLLASHGLKPEMFPSERLTKEDEIKSFFSIDSKDNSQHNSAPAQSGREILISVSLPKTLIADKTDANVISSIRDLCQSAFERAVMNAVCTTLAKVDSRLSIFQEQSKDTRNCDEDHAVQDGDVLREIKVPITCRQELSDVFTKAVLKNIAHEIGGLTLYPLLKDHLANPALETYSYSK